MPPDPPELARMPFAGVWNSLPEIGSHVDPFDFAQRLAIYKRLMACTNQAGVFGEDNRHNIFWGYVSQTAWQQSSGRFVLADTPRGAIDHNCLWGYANHSLSVIPLIAAIQAGLTPEIQIAPAPSSSLVAYASGGAAAGPFAIPPILVPALDEWRSFFSRIASMKVGDDLEPIRFALWKAHERSLIAAGAGCGSLRAACSNQEVAFFTGWIRMVDFLAAAAWRTDLEYLLANGLGMLPDRMLTDDDVPGTIQDMSDQVNRNLKNILDLVALPAWRFNLFLFMWRRAMRTREARDNVLPMLDATFNPSRENRAARRRLFRYMLAP